MSARAELAWTLAVALTSAAAPPGGDPDEPIVLTEGLRVGRVGVSRRAPLFTDAVEALRVRGEWRTPQAGDTVARPDGSTVSWEPIAAGDDGAFPPGGDYTSCVRGLEADGVWLLDARGHRQVLVNGEPRGGDLYNLGWMRLPVFLHAGDNEFLFRSGRGRLTAGLHRPPAPVFFELRDDVLPDVQIGTTEPLWAAVLVTNATTSWQRDLTIHAAVGDETRVSPVPALPPLGQRKVPVRLPVAAPAGDPAAGVTCGLRLRRDDATLHERSIHLSIRDPGREHHRCTFVSEIDGSVQYYGVAPKRPGETPPEGDALVLSLHGAGVEGAGQAACYRPRDWAWVVAPTNRRIYGFDWEDWGRLDALEALADARRRHAIDPRRISLTGHSMGGHGTWNLGAQRPDLFAAIAPSAGWRDFWSYAGASSYAEESAAARMLDRAVNTSRTLLAKDNLARLGVYVLHGDADDNVPVSQARFMRGELATFHGNWAYYERPDAGHWWGNQCVDWPPLMDFLRQNVKPAPEGVTRVAFTTLNPAVASRCDWITVESQQHSLQPSHVEASFQASPLRVTVTTDNVRRLAVDLSCFVKAVDGVDSPAPGTPCQWSLDGEERARAWPADGVVRWHRPADAWVPVDEVPPVWKSPLRAGPFKDAFRHRMQFVVATGGSDEHHRWALAKARFDAETFQYRGNGSIDVVLDVDFDPDAEPDRGVVLYGNADSHRAWPALLGSSPIQVGEGSVTVGDTRIEGDDRIALFVRPRPGSDRACVAAVSASGPAGRRAAEQLPYFVSGVAYPDWIVLGADFLWRGADGVRAAGFFDEAWALDEADSAWADAD